MADLIALNLDHFHRNADIKHGGRRRGAWVVDFMFLATVNKSKQLLHLSFIEQVRVEELAQGREELVALLADLSPGYRLLADLDRLDSMSVECATEIGKVMELCDQKGVKLVVRVIPDPRKDIGLGVLTLFHYHHRPRTVTCQNMVEAAKLLSL